jgi:hypothetical protein
MEAYEIVDDGLNKQIDKLKEKFWSEVAEKLSHLTGTPRFSARVCKERYEKLLEEEVFQPLYQILDPIIAATASGDQVALRSERATKS